jgi:hypothetical protein
VAGAGGGVGSAVGCEADAEPAEGGGSKGVPDVRPQTPHPLSSQTPRHRYSLAAGACNQMQVNAGNCSRTRARVRTLPVTERDSGIRLHHDAVTATETPWGVAAPVPAARRGRHSRRRLLDAAPAPPRSSRAPKPRSPAARAPGSCLPATPHPRKGRLIGFPGASSNGLTRRAQRVQRWGLRKKPEDHGTTNKRSTAVPRSPTSAFVGAGPGGKLQAMNDSISAPLWT